MVQLVEGYKYKSIRKTAELLAEFLDKRLPEFSEPVVIVPLPTISKHIRERGFDHTRLLAKKLAARRPGFSASLMLTRHDKAVQVGSDAKTRKKQAAAAYEVASKADPKTPYLLLDDVWTTGASMEAAISAMKKAGAVKLASAVMLCAR